MSVFELRCAEDTSGLVCDHIARFYPHIAGDPVVYYIIEDEELPPGSVLTQNPSDTGDDCHHEVDASNKALYKAFKSRRDFANFMICAEGEHRPLADGDLDRLGRPPS